MLCYLLKRAKQRDTQQINIYKTVEIYQSKPEKEIINSFPIKNKSALQVSKSHR